MKKFILIVFIGLSLSSCSLLHVHKTDVEQGNIITQEKIKRLHLGMTQEEVIAIMGTSLTENIFVPHRVDYIYTYQPGRSRMVEKRLTLIFKNGRLQDIQQTTFIS